MAEKENLTTTTLKFRYSSEKMRKSLLKNNKALNTHLSKERSFKKLPNIEAVGNQGPHPTLKYLFGTNPTQDEHRKFAKLLYQGLFYSVCSLKGPSQEYIRKKSVRLPERVRTANLIQKQSRSSSCWTSTRLSSILSGRTSHQM